MPRDNFLQRKKAVLLKRDKSSKQSWDEKIAKLCEAINKKDDYYTTSSCSGRIVVMKDEDKKAPNLFEFVSHDLISFEELKKELGKIKKDTKFKQEPPILHVACKNLKDAFDLLNKARRVGWKRSGVISEGKMFVAELISTEKLEFPLTRKGKLLVDDNFLKIVLEKANKNLKKSWEKIEKLENLLK